MIFLLLWLLPVHCTEPPQTIHKPIQVCPSVGYFFERQGPESACYLCYCKDDNDAVCTLRDSERCNEVNYSYQMDVEETTLRKHRRRKHRRRSRRSAVAGLMDLFFKTANKDQEILKSMAHSSSEVCKPKSSKSIGCPPMDWCEGCLVCDCDDESQWQCHVMSFCDDKLSKSSKDRKLKREHKNDSMNPVNDQKKDNTTNKIRVNNNGKRSVKQKKRFKKKTTTTRPTSTMKPKRNKNRPITTKPLIAVQVKKGFKRKNDKNKDVIIIKKYISTLAPITDSELLKYKNDSRKLAQILYQQYESSTHSINHVKREIRSEPKAGGKMLLTHEFYKTNRFKHDSANSKNMGDKIFSMKQQPKIKLNNNARGRKPMNIKEHNDRNSEMKARKEKHASFYDTQKELLDVESHLIEHNQNKRKSGDPKRKKEIKLMSRRRRNKRNVQLSIPATRNTTDMENEIVNASSVSSDAVSEIPESITNYEESTTSLNNYVYTPDNTVTPNYDSNVITNLDIGYETTATNVDIFTIGASEKENDTLTTANNLDTFTIGGSQKENYTLTDTVNYTTIENVPTTETLNLDSKTSNLTYYNVSKTEQPPIENNYSLETTTNVDLLDNEQLKPKKNVTTEITTLMENMGTESIEKEPKQYVKNDTEISNNTNTTANIIKKVHVQDTDRINTYLNKCKLKKWIIYNNSKGTTDNITSLNNTSDNKHTRTDFNTMLQSITNNTKYRSKKNRMVAIKYLKKLYSKLLSNKNNKTLLNNVAVMESICDTFGPCKISTSSVEVINFKITELIAETKRALNIITTIKRLLESIENGNNTGTGTGNSIEEVEFKTHVKKLNAILTDNWATPLTEAQMTKMKIIKNHTKVFINSIGKFALILNDILRIIRTDKSKYESTRRGKILLNRVSKKKSVSEPLHKIKNLFLKYNVLQNSFMRNMYQAISDLELQYFLNNKATDEYKIDPRDRKYKTSVNKYMSKINYNLKKLTDLAIRMGAKERVKRNAMRDDDAVDYLLTLMEYLLKKNNPLEPPVTDGIDLLIDAIRRAPDIKPIKKKILYLTPTTPYQELSKSSSESEDENLSFFKNRTESFKDMSFEKPFFNETQILQSIPDNDIEEYKTTTDEPKITFVPTTRYIDVEDLVFNGNDIQKVYIATFPPDDVTEDSYFMKETPEPPKNFVNSGKKYSLPKSEVNGERTFSLSNKTDAEPQPIIESLPDTRYPPTAKSNAKTQFDLLNEEYERRLTKVKPPTAKTVKMKHKKPKRPKKKQKVVVKTDVSSITKEVDDEKTRKNIVAEEAMLRKHMLNSADDYDPFKSLGEDSISEDMSPLHGSETFPSMFP